MKAIKVAALLLLLMTVEEGQCYQSSLTRPNFSSRHQEISRPLNEYERCGGRCKCAPPFDFPTHVDCSDTEAEEFPSMLPTQTRVLVLDNNAIRRLDSMLSMYSQLEDLSIRNNQIRDVDPNPRGIFADLNKLIFLDLSNNHIGRLVNPLTFVGLSNLRELSLKGNQITEISGDVFRPLEKLERLDLAANRITILGSTVFEGNTNLQELYLRSNVFREIPDGALQPLENLAVLDLSDNTFDQIQPNAFAGNQQLTDLNLKGCNLRSLHETAFSHLSSLKFLDISNNFLTYIPGGSSLRRLDHLEVLRVGANQIREIKESDMKPLTNLKYLSIDGCRSMDGDRDSNNEFRIDSDAFKHNTELVQVNITECPGLKRLDSGTFTYLPSLRLLNFHQSGIEEIAYDAADWTTLGWLDLTGNALRCDCGLVFLTYLAEKVAKSGNKLGIPAVMCAQPEEFRGHFLSRVNQRLVDQCGDGYPGKSSGPKLEVIIGSVVGVMVVLVAIGFVAYCLRKRQKEGARMVQWAGPHHASNSANSNDCWACGWTEKRHRRKVKRPNKPIIKSDIRVNTLTVGETPPGFIDVKIPDECELEDSETENLYEVPVGPRSNYPDIKTTVL